MVSINIRLIILIFSQTEVNELLILVKSSIIPPSAVDNIILEGCYNSLIWRNNNTNLLKNLKYLQEDFREVSCSNVCQDDWWVKMSAKLSIKMAVMTYATV